MLIEKKFTSSITEFTEQELLTGHFPKQ